MHIMYPVWDTISRCLRTHEAIQHPLPPCLLELNLQLVAFDRVDRAVAELAVEHALTDAEVVAALVAEADGGGFHVDRGAGVGVGSAPHPPIACAMGPSLSLRGRGAGAKAALEAGAAALGPGDVRE